MSSDHVPGAIPQAEQTLDGPLGGVPLGAMGETRGESRQLLRDADLQLAAAEVERAVEALAAPARPQHGTSTDSDKAAVRATFEDLAAIHVSPVRNLMLEVRWGEPPTRYIGLARPSLQSLTTMAAALELDDLVAALTTFDLALGETLAGGEEQISGGRRERLLGAYFPLQSGFASAFGLEGGKERREPIVIDALLQDVDGVDQAVLDRLCLVGLGRLEPLLKARPDEIAVVSDIPRTVAELIVARVRERVQAAPRGLSTQTRGARAGRKGEPRTVLEWLTAELLREQTLMRLRRGERVERPNLRGADLAGADLRRLDLRRAQLADANLVGADLGGANLENAELRGAKLDRANLMGANLSRADLTAAELRGTNLRGSRLSFATLVSANLTGASLRDATVMHADLEHATLRQVVAAGGNFSGAHFRGALLEQADFTRARLDDTGLENVRAAGANFAGTTFAAANLQGADLAGSDLREADLRRATLDGANFSGALVAGIRPSGTPASGLQVDCLLLGERGQWAPVEAADLGARIAAVFTGVPGPPALATAAGSTGTADHLVDARLLLADAARVTLAGLLERCDLHLGPGTDLTIAPEAALVDCRIFGGRQLTIHGALVCADDSPPLELAAVTVGADGVLVATVRQTGGHTRFSFERGSRLRLTILPVT